MIKRHLVSALAILAATTPAAAYVRCAPTAPAQAASVVPVIDYKSTTIDGVKVFYARRARTTRLC
ncbi:hypothetical protein [Sphingomonas sp. LaA6.9]|uniref:hypothetical protein n=1 Tax=Sphingomonas sp. LaA6.9 TaxID=2919914 RepID=UPI001F4F2D8F|nr:hypothetical protein [Sphingomonas sp. LaA6.9]MCJ8159177.1 hypothetical protein [Sphingomonas sp. LaA6.9]